MATISARTEESIFKIRKWGGLHESPDGDTKLNLGEAAVMRNFKVTRDGNLQRRPGSATILGLLQAYTILTEEKAEIVRTDSGVCSTLTMYPTATAETDGFVSLSGTSVSVSIDNSTQYAGYYWRYDAFHIWQLVSCTEDAGTGNYIWSMKRVTAVSASTNKKVAGLWSGRVNGVECLVAACDGKLWSLWNAANEIFQKVSIGDISTDWSVFMFGFSGKLYLLNGTQYKEWDGTTFKDVDGYRPLVSVTVPPGGGGSTLEQVNKLTGTRRCRFSPEGTSTVFVLPEKNLASIDYVHNTADGSDYTASTYTKDLGNGKVTFASAPPEGTDSIEIGWTVSTNFKAQVLAMHYAELFNGTQDSRVFFYGDGSNKAFYSGLDYDGNPRADYIPDENEIAFGEANAPVTGMIRHYSRLIAFKDNSAYSVQYGTITLADNRTVPAYYCTPVNRSIGNAAAGQVQLVLNSPRTLFGDDLYEWKNNSSYSSNLSVDERQAKRISDRIYATLASFDTGRCVCWDDNEHQEYYICCDGRALVNNYAADAWYTYENFPAVCMASFQGETYFGTADGRLVHLSHEYMTDDGELISAYWESGATDFGQDWRRKYSQEIFIGIKPEYNAEIIVTAQTDRKSDYAAKVVAKNLSTFSHVNYARFSFGTNRKPTMTRLKLKAKKFTYYKLILENKSLNTTATIVAVDIKVRYSGEVK